MRLIFILLVLASFPLHAQQSILKLQNLSQNTPFLPLESVEVTSSQPGILVVSDGLGRKYLQGEIADQLSLNAGGALGIHQVMLLDKKGRLLDKINFQVDARTEISDDAGFYKKLLNTLYYSMVKSGHQTQIRYNDEFHDLFVIWLRDHVHTLKGMKYFYPELKSGIDLFAKTQRADGMIWDNVYPRNKEKNWWDRRFRYGDFIMDAENGTIEFKRIPIENDVEYLFIEGIYYTWKASGDDRWMKGLLGNALKAVEYATTDPYRWSEKYKLLKRGFTIDTWDFQSTEDARQVDGFDIMRVELDKTRFGIMFGDNTGMATACGMLAEMLREADRTGEAEKVAGLSQYLQRRIDSLAWNGNFYTHHIPEDPNVVRDLGVDQSKQVSLSNAYSINRNIEYAQKKQIIETYLRLKDEMPEGSPGEWYTIYPPFEKGFGLRDSSSKWQYMNGGVTAIVAGELAHGAFENGYESYGVDILERIAALAAKTDDYLHCAYTGSMPDPPNRSFSQLRLAAQTNTSYPNPKATFENRSFYTGLNESGMVELEGIPFYINQSDPNPTVSLHGRSKPEAVVPVNTKAASIYLLHGTPNKGLSGKLEVVYQDGSKHHRYVQGGQIGSWWNDLNNGESGNKEARKAWRSDNDHYEALYVWGVENPFPDKMIKELRLKAVDNDNSWHVTGITTSDHGVYFQPSVVSHGIPDGWGAAAVVYGLVEGLAGVKDTGVAYNEALIVPRWEAAGTKEVTVCIKYEASGGYVRYQYSMQPDKLKMQITGSFERGTVRILLPENAATKAISLNGKRIEPSYSMVGNSRYLSLPELNLGVHELEVTL